jgi:hypothetical protein
VKRTRLKTLEAIFAYPTSANIAWKDIEALFVALGANRQGSSGVCPQVA